MLAFDSKGNYYAKTEADDENEYSVDQKEFKDFVRHLAMGQSGDYIVTEEAEKGMFKDRHRKIFKYDDLIN